MAKSSDRIESCKKLNNLLARIRSERYNLELALEVAPVSVKCCDV